VPRPLYAHGLVYICTGWSPPKLLAIDPTGKGNVTDTHIVWKTNRVVPNTPSPLIIGDELYFVSDRGVISCVDAKSGETHWSKRVGGGFSASPVYADGKIYFQSEQGVTTVIKPGLEYEELATNEFPGERTLASYAIADSAIFLRTDRHLYRIQQR
jgi:outer membrane protein assembly factor BamB